ncbi:MAG: 16S rRNA (guanine(527)-N(7))-methyltransferase RsmG [Cyanobacteria bacterium RI_101]|nr:16S rRNA (guanine(527)-N(7))-methyltransferase RsmG [Cyanobacteria bacterium RI_101]
MREASEGLTTALAQFPWPEEWRPWLERGQAWTALYDCVLTANRSFNLTRITAPGDFVEKHLWDSLAGVLSLPELAQAEQLRAIDIGTGAGFPAFPLALTWPQWQMTALDSTRKKVTFIQTAAQTLGLTRLAALAGRAEILGQTPEHRETYDLAVIRAVAESRVCAEYVLPFLKLGGQGVLYRGQTTAEELAALTPAVKLLGGEIQTVISLKTPLTQAERQFIYLRKVAQTPKAYPRAAGLPRQSPL